MDNMLESLQRQYPLSIAMFKSWFIRGYRTDIAIYENAPVEDKCKEILRFLGHPLTLDTSDGADSLVTQIKSSLHHFEELMINNSTLRIDPLKSLSILPYHKRTKEKALIFEHDNMNISIRSALRMIDRPNKSIRDSLKELKSTVTKIVVDNYCSKEIPKMNPKEICPF
jgi:hypothetical protein